MSGASFKLDVDSVDSYAGYVMHMGPIASGSIQIGDAVEYQMDYVRRAKVARDHTMTHVLNCAAQGAGYDCGSMGVAGG